MSEEDTQSSEKPSTEAMLSVLEARVLGTLMEKQLTTPDQYPLTLNSLVIGCNQKTSREPISNYTKGEIENCINKLRDRKLVEVEYGSRASRYDQRLSRQLFLEKPAQAVLTIMLLRGPQTVNELLTRTDRMTRFENAGAVQDLLNTLCQKTSPIILHLPRQAGQREDRYMHLLCGEAAAQAASVIKTSTASSQSEDELVARIEELERKLAKILTHLDLDDEH